MSEIAIDRDIVDGVKPARLRRKRAKAWDDTLYQISQRWVGTADATFEPWPGRPNCGHFYGGSYWYGLETAHTAFVLAALAAAGPYDESVAGTPRNALAEHAIAGVRYLGFTHDSGPPDCVRAKGSNPHASERKWGGEGDGFFQASQHGTTVSLFGQAAWLLWDQLDDETRQLVATVVATYADTWCDHPAADGVYVNTQTEENGWTGQGIGLAALMLPHHPHAERWKAGAERWMANICMTPYDRMRSRELLQGRPVNQWAQAITTHPDFTAENHDFVHPSYMGSGIGFAGMYALFCRHAGAPIPEVVRFNREPLYDVLKAWAEPDGSLTPVQGQDWWYVTHYGATLIHATMNVLFDDPEAAYLERQAADTARKIAGSVGGGHLYITDPTTARLNQFQSMRTAERGAVSAVLRAYLLHCTMGDGSEPGTPARFERARKGVRSFPQGGLATRRGKDTFAAFSWRNRPLALVQPKGRSWEVTPHPRSLLGTFRTEEGWSGGMADGRSRVDDGGEQMRAVMAVEREGGALLQHAALLVADDEPAFYFDQVTARREVTILEQRGGEVSIRNEGYAQLGRLARGSRTIFTGQEPAVAEARFGGEDEWFHWPKARWANVDDAIGYIVAGSAGVSYQACHNYPTYRGLEDYLILSYDATRRTVREAGRVSSLAIAIAPNQAHEATEALARETIRPRSPRDADALIAGDGLGVVNFADRQRDVRLTWPIGDAVPIFAGRTEIGDGTTTLTVSLPPMGGAALHALAHTDPEPGTVVATATGDVFAERTEGWVQL